MGVFSFVGVGPEQADRSTRAFNPAQAATILAQYGSMKERNEAAGYYEK